MTFSDGPEDYDFRGDQDDDVSLDPELNSIVDHLRDTLTHEMAMRIIPNRLGITPQRDENLEELMEVLIADAFNDGYNNWDDFPY
jgi:hypothetical protein